RTQVINMFLNFQGRFLASLLTLLCLLIAWLFNISSVAAQPNNTQQKNALPWYQIEVIIFENRGSNTYAPDPEVWPRNILVAYPTHSRYLLTPEELKELEAQEALVREEAIRAGASPESFPGPQEKPFIDLG